MTKFVLFTLVLTAFALMGCDGAYARKTPEISPEVQTEVHPCTLQLPTRYIGYDTEATILGKGPNGQLPTNIRVTDTDENPNDLEWSFHPKDLEEGTYEFTYLNAKGERASFDTLKELSPPTRFWQYVQCNWWDDVARIEHDVAKPRCVLRMTLTRIVETGYRHKDDDTELVKYRDRSCTIGPKGNMSTHPAYEKFWKNAPLPNLISYPRYPGY